MASRRIVNTFGSADTYLKAVKLNLSSAKFKSSLSSKEKQLAEEVVSAVSEAIKAQAKDDGDYQLQLDSKLSDNILGRMASLMDEVKEKFVDEELAEVKDAIIEAIEDSTDSLTSTIFKTLLVSVISSFFDNTATKDDIAELKEFFKAELDARKEDANGGEEPKNIFNKEDLKDGDYQDSTIATNFATLQTFIKEQFDRLAKVLESATSVPAPVMQAAPAVESGDVVGQINAQILESTAKLSSQIEALDGKVGKTAGVTRRSLMARLNSLSTKITKVSGGLWAKTAAGFKSIGGRVGGLGKFIWSKTAGAFKLFGGKLGTLGKTIGGFISAKFLAVTAGIGSIVAGGIALFKGITGLGKFIGDKFKAIGSGIKSAITAPFRLIGGLFSAINPFKSKQKRKAEEKSNLSIKDKINFIYKFNKRLADLIDPVLEKAEKFAKLIKKWVVTPIMMMVAKVVLFGVLLAAAGVLLYLAYRWVKNKVIWLAGQIKHFFTVKLPKYWKDFKAWVSKWWNKGINWVKKVWNGAVDWVKRIWNGAINWIKGVWESTKKFVVDLWNGAINWVKKAWKAVKGWASKVWNGAINFIKTRWAATKAFISKVWNGAINWVKEKWTAVKTWAAGIWKSAVDWVKGIWDKSINWITSTWQKAKDWVIGLWDKLSKWAKGLWDGAVNWVKGVWESTKQKAVAIWTSVRDWAVGLWDGAVGWVKEKWTAVKTWVVGLWDKSVKWVKDIWKGVKDWVKGIWTGMLNKITNAWNYVKELPGRLKNWILENVVNRLIDTINCMMKRLAEVAIPVPKIDFHDSINPLKWEFSLADAHPFGFLAGKTIERIQIVQSPAPAEEVANVAEQVVEPSFGDIQAIRSLGKDDNKEVQEAKNVFEQEREKKDKLAQEQLDATNRMNKNMESLFGAMSGKLDERKYVPMPIIAEPAGNTMPNFATFANGSNRGRY